MLFEKRSILHVQRICRKWFSDREPSTLREVIVDLQKEPNILFKSSQLLYANCLWLEWCIFVSMRVHQKTAWLSSFHSVIPPKMHFIFLFCHRIQRKISSYTSLAMFWNLSKVPFAQGKIPGLFQEYSRYLEPFKDLYVKNWDISPSQTQKHPLSFSNSFISRTLMFLSNRKTAENVYIIMQLNLEHKNVSVPQ